MNPVVNPFAPGAGTRPPELAGRTEILENANVALARLERGRSAKGQLLLGLRGVGKTVLLNEIARNAEERGHRVVELEAPENRSLPELLVPRLRLVLNRLSTVEKARQLATRALRGLQAFASVFKISYAQVEVGVAEPGVADSGDLETDLPELLILAAEAARAAGTPISIFLDEVQYLSAADLSALLVAIHKIGQRNLPLILFGAGLPQLAALAGEAKSYAERLFDYPPVGPLRREDAEWAIREPLRKEQVDITGDALALVVARTEGYPYFLQEWGAFSWNVAAESPISKTDVERATEQAVRQLDEGFFRVRLDRLTSREKDYLRAMAELGAGPHASGAIASQLGMRVTAAGPLRNGLIQKGMIYSPKHGETAFTVPLFDAFMRRSMPDWKRAKRRGTARGRTAR